MHQPPSTAPRVCHDKLTTFAYQALAQVGLAHDHADLLSRLLVDNDLRGNFSHGTHQLPRYLGNMQKGTLNPAPDVKLVHETPSSVVMDGDGGLGYFPAYEGTRKTIDKAQQIGMAAMVCRNHGHIGAAGIYTRMAVEHDMCAFVTSGVQMNLKPEFTVYRAAGASPMSFSAPANGQPPLVLDCGVSHDLQGPNQPHRDDVASLTPGLVLRAIGFGTVCQAWGGLLAGVPVDPSSIERTYRQATQGTMLFAFKVSLFADTDEFKRQMDQYARQTRELTPIEGTEAASLPGGLEAQREPTYRAEGIPLGEPHQERLQKAAEMTGVDLTWD